MPRTRDLKSIVLHALSFLDPEDARERASLERMRAELFSLERPFERDGGPVHFTASAIVVGPQGTILHLHKKLGIWLQPGGHIDPGETPWEAALREVAEETGLRGALVSPPLCPPAIRPPTITSTDLPVASSPRLLHVDVHPAGDHVHLDLRYLVAASGPPSPPPDESQDVAWFAWDDALGRADPGLIGALRTARRWLPDLDSREE